MFSMISFRYDRVHCLDESGDNFFLRHMRGFAFPVPIEFVIAAVNHPAVLVIGMPDLGAVPTSALRTFYLVGEDADPAVPRFAFLGAFGKFRLHQVEYARLNDGFVVAFHIILGNFRPRSVSSSSEGNPP